MRGEVPEAATENVAVVPGITAVSRGAVFIAGMLTTRSIAAAVTELPNALVTVHLKSEPLSD